MNNLTFNKKAPILRVKLGLNLAFSVLYNLDFKKLRLSVNNMVTFNQQERP